MNNFLRGFLSCAAVFLCGSFYGTCPWCVWSMLSHVRLAWFLMSAVSAEPLVCSRRQRVGWLLEGRDCECVICACCRTGKPSCCRTSVACSFVTTELVIASRIGESARTLVVLDVDGQEERFNMKSTHTHARIQPSKKDPDRVYICVLLFLFPSCLLFIIFALPTCNTGGHSK